MLILERIAALPQATQGSTKPFTFRGLITKIDVVDHWMIRERTYAALGDRSAIINGEDSALEIRMRASQRRGYNID